MKPGLNSLQEREACHILLPLESHCSNNGFLLSLLLPHLWNNIGKPTLFFLNIQSKEARVLRSRPNWLITITHSVSRTIIPDPCIPAKAPIQKCLFPPHTNPYGEGRSDVILQPIRTMSCWFKNGRSPQKFQLISNDQMLTSPVEPEDAIFF